MKKYKLLRHGHCYINRTGDLVIALMKGNKDVGYQFAAACCCPDFYLMQLQTLSRVVLNDGNWIEIDLNAFNAASVLLATGHTVKFPAEYLTSGELPIITKAY